MTADTPMPPEEQRPHPAPHPEAPLPIIDRPQSMSELRQRTEWSLTAFGWFVWGLLSRPLLIFLLWYLGVRQVYVHMIKLGGARYLITFMERYAFIIGLVTTILLAWHLYNRLRYGRNNRRKAVEDAGVEEIAAILQIRPEALRLLQGCKTVDIHFGPEGRVTFQANGPRSGAGPAPIPGHYDPARPHLPASGA